ncbi:MAG: hypothetical protein RLZZ627_789 [Pseudomonadota bacterium]
MMNQIGRDIQGLEGICREIAHLIERHQTFAWRQKIIVNDRTVATLSCTTGHMTQSNASYASLREDEVIGNPMPLGDQE